MGWDKNNFLEGEEGMRRKGEGKREREEGEGSLEFHNSAIPVHDLQFSNWVASACKRNRIMIFGVVFMFSRATFLKIILNN